MGDLQTITCPKCAAEIELSEEQEAWLEWMVGNELQHIRLE